MVTVPVEPMTSVLANKTGWEEIAVFEFVRTLERGWILRHIQMMRIITPSVVTKVLVIARRESAIVMLGTLDRDVAVKPVRMIAPVMARVSLSRS